MTEICTALIFRQPHISSCKTLTFIPTMTTTSTHHHNYRSRRTGPSPTPWQLTVSWQMVELCDSCPSMMTSVR